MAKATKTICDTARLHRYVVEEMFKILQAVGLHDADYCIDLTSIQSRTFREIPAFVLASGPKQHAHAIDAEPIQLVDRP